MAPSVVTTMLVDIEASTWVILLGPGLVALRYFFPGFYGQAARLAQWLRRGLPAGPIVSLFLKRLGTLPLW
jgi:hypothetical protein